VIEVRFQLTNDIEHHHAEPIHDVNSHAAPLLKRCKEQRYLATHERLHVVQQARLVNVRDALEARAVLPVRQVTPAPSPNLQTQPSRSFAALT
jgi:hypothetical protein